MFCRVCASRRHGKTFCSVHCADIFFFGDSKIGLEIGVEAYRQGKKPILELAGNDFMVVWEDAPVEKAVQALLDGFQGSLQICMAPKKALIHPAIYDRFVECFVKEVQEKVKVGLPSNPQTYLTPVARIKEFYQVMEEATGMGAQLLCGGRRLNYRGELDPRGNFVEATVVSIEDDAPLRFRCVAEENFFPLMPLIRMKSHATATARQIFDWAVDVVPIAVQLFPASASSAARVEASCGSPMGRATSSRAAQLRRTVEASPV